ncbi:MAG: right-handed parallel beta-helix repeat-containing protein [Candidatus Electrothrix gigas]
MRKQTYWWMLLTAAFLFLLAPWMAAQAADITVDESICTLADAITAANTDTATGDCPAGDSGADTIILQADVTLAAALPEISSTITIEGGGHFISGNDDPAVGSVLYVNSSGNLTLNEITVKDGNKMGNGGGIYNLGTIMLINSTVSNNMAASYSLKVAPNGGGIYNAGTITLTSSTVSGNTLSSYGSTASPCGGGIYNAGTTTLTNSIVNGNTAVSYDFHACSDSCGGGIYNAGTVTLTSSTVSGNTAGRSSTGDCSRGGGVYNEGTITLKNCTINNNTSASAHGKFGGGIYNVSGTATLINCTVSGNIASSYGGGICNGGAILTMTNSTVSGNTSANGGGIYHYYFNSRSALTLTNCTVSGNTASSRGGGISAGCGTITLQSSIISGNTAPRINEFDNYSCPFTTSGHNIFGHSGETTAEAFYNFSRSGSDVNATSNGTQPTALDAILSPLADNGGPTLTHALVAGSPAIDLDADCSIGLTTDQRGMPRPSGVGCDAGAVEYSPSISTACGNGRDLPANTWLMTAPSCQPADPPGTGIDAQYGNDIPGGVYGTDWIGWQWDADQQKYPPAMAGTDPLVLGTGNWVYSTTAGILVLDGTATTTEPCSDYGPGLTGQCFAIDLVPSAGAALWQIVGHPFPYTANWADVRVAAFDGTTWTQRTPSEAETADLMLKTFWRWTGSAYESHDDSTPGMLGILQPQESFWVRILPGSSAFNVEGIKLLIPAR